MASPSVSSSLGKDSVKNNWLQSPKRSINWWGRNEPRGMKSGRRPESLLWEENQIVDPSSLRLSQNRLSYNQPAPFLHIA